MYYRRVSSIPDPPLRRETRRASGPDGGALRREAEILGRARHPGVIELVAVSSADGTTQIDTALPEGMTLDALALAIEEVAGVIAAVATTVADLHDVGVFHGALAPDAVVVGDDGRPVLRGFARSGRLDGPPSRWPRHPLARHDDRNLGALLAEILDRSAPDQLVGALEAARRPAWWPTRASRARGAGPAAVIRHWATAAAAGTVSSRRLAEALATEITGARLPTRVSIPRTTTHAHDPALTDEALEDWFGAPGGPDERPATMAARRAAIPSARPQARRVAAAAAVAALLVVASCRAMFHGLAAHVTRPPAAHVASPAGPPTVATGSAAPGADAARPPAAPIARPPGTPADHPVAPAPSGPPAVATGSAGCVPTVGAECPTYRSGILTVGRDRFAIGSPGDLVAIGRWSCATATVALVRPSGEVWIYRTWPGDAGPVVPVAAGTVAGPRSVAIASRGGCDSLLVVTATGEHVVLDPQPR